MTLTLAVYVNALYACRSEGVHQAELLEALISCVDENDDEDDNSYLAPNDGSFIAS